MYNSYNRRMHLLFVELDAVISINFMHLRCGCVFDVSFGSDVVSFDLMQLGGWFCMIRRLTG